MNKIAIPALLVATVMVAGIFAFVPVEQASTIHTTSSSGLITEVETSTILDDSSADTHTITYTFDSDSIVYGIHIALPTTESADNYDIASVTVNGAALLEDTTFTNPGANVDLDENWLQTYAHAQFPLHVEANDTIVIAIEEDDVNDGATDDTLTVTFVYSANTGATISSNTPVIT